MRCQSSFQQYLNASMTSYHESISSAALPPYYTYMHTSDKVFSTFAWTTEADRKKIWQEAIKYGKSFVPHFGLRDMLGFSSTPRKKNAVSQPSHVITTRGTLDDSRLAVETALDISRGLVAVVDHIARVVLIDITNRQIVRIWKGYREATVAWISSSNDQQTALFLAIFAPRRALLEVWNVQFSSSPNLDSFMEVYSMLRMMKSKRELILLVLPIVNDSLRLEKVLDAIPKTDGAGPVEELVGFVRRQLNVFNKIVRYTKQIVKTTGNTPECHFNEDVQNVIRRHCVEGDEDGPLPMTVNEFLGFIDCKSMSSSLWERNYPDADLFRFGEFVFGPALQGRVDVETFIDSVLVELPFALEDFTDLLGFVFTKSHSKVGEEGFACLCGFIKRFDQLHPGSLEKCERMALECTNLSRALLLYAACCLVKAQQPKKCEIEETEPMDTGEETALVQGMSYKQYCSIAALTIGNPLIPAWSTPIVPFSRCMLAFLACQLRQPVPFAKVVSSARAFFREQVSITLLLSRSAFSESLVQVASLVAREKWNPNQLEEKLSSIASLNELCSLLPNSLKFSLLCCDIAWELMSQWFKDTMQCFNNFELALGYLALVDDNRLRHGVLALMWQNFILERFKATILLIEKTGRGPKEREARQQLQMAEIRVVEFLSRCHELLKMLMDDVRDSPPPSQIQQDHLIEVKQPLKDIANVL
ncbi:hypothetical protein COOONC_17328 [Cooperia oncophora]